MKIFEKVAQSQRNILTIISLIFVFSTVATALFDHSNTSMILRGDFPGFYGPTWQVFIDGDSAHLYDFEAQRHAQNKFFPSLNNNFFIFAYPPFTTIYYSLFVFLNSTVAKVLCTILMFGCTLFAFSLIKVKSRFDRSLLIMSTAFFPLFIANVGAQNTGFTLMLLATGLLLLCKQVKSAVFLSGIVFALLAYKPQFGLFIVAYLIIVREYYALLGMCCGLVFLYLCGAIVSGFDWPFLWLNTVGQFSMLNYETNLAQLCSLSAIVYYGFSLFVVPKEIINYGCYGAFAVALLFMCAYLHRRYENGCDKTTTLYLLLCSVPLISPQTLFYDLGIGFFGLIGLIKNGKGETLEDHTVMVFACIVAFISEVARHQVTFPIYGFLSLLIFLFALKKARHFPVSS